MKRIPSVFIAFFIIILTAACSAQNTVAPAAIAQSPAVTITPLSIATLPPTATPPPTAEPTGTPSPTASPAIPSPTPTIAYAQECITIEGELPADLDASGMLLLQGGRYASRWSRSMVHLDLMSTRRSPLPYSAVSLTLSPDGKWLAYIQQGYDGMGRVKDRFLKVTDAEGRHLNLSYWGLNWQTLLGWQDTDHLLLHVPGYPGGDHIILNPFSGEKTVLAESPFADQQAQEQAYGVAGGAILSTSLDGRFLAGWAQLDPPGSGYPFPNHLVLIDAENPRVTDLCFQNQPPSDIGWLENAVPIWSPDGRYLAVAVSRIEQRSNSRYTQEILIWDTAIINLQERRGYLLAKDARPQAWMRKP